MSDPTRCERCGIDLSLHEIDWNKGMCSPCESHWANDMIEQIQSGEMKTYPYGIELWTEAEREDDDA